MQLIANSSARLSWRLTLVQTLQYEVHSKAPKEEAAGRTAGDEECGDQEEDSNADS
jgi:hypothetical protein